MNFPLTARRLMFQSKGRTAIETETLDSPQADQVLLVGRTSVISPGTELAYLHQVENARWPFPGSPDEGFCGEVAACGPGVTRFSVGDLVVTTLGHCSAGLVAQNKCHPVPKGLPAGEAAIFKILTASLQGVRKSRVRLGQSVAVVGLGVIGNLAGQLARAAGATLVVGMDPVEWRRALALRTGFDFTLPTSSRIPVDEFVQLKAAGGFDVVIEATGLPAPIVDAFRLSRKMGTVVLLGSARGITEKVDFYNDVHKRSLTVVGAHSTARSAVDDIDVLFTEASDIRTALDLMASHRVQAGPLISETIPGEKAPEAYERLSARTEPLMTFGLRWS